MPHSSPCDGEVWGSGTGFVMDRFPGVFSFPFVLSLSLRNEGRGLSATTGVCPGVLLGLLSPWDQACPFS